MSCGDVLESVSDKPLVSAQQFGKQFPATLTQVPPPRVRNLQQQTTDMKTLEDAADEPGLRLRIWPRASFGDMGGDWCALGYGGLGVDVAVGGMWCNGAWRGL